MRLPEDCQRNVEEIWWVANTSESRRGGQSASEVQRKGGERTHDTTLHPVTVGELLRLNGDGRQDCDEGDELREHRKSAPRKEGC